MPRQTRSNVNRRTVQLKAQGQQPKLPKTQRNSSTIDLADATEDQLKAVLREFYKLHNLIYEYCFYFLVSMFYSHLNRTSGWGIYLLPSYLLNRLVFENLLPNSGGDNDVYNDYWPLALPITVSAVMLERLMLRDIPDLCVRTFLSPENEVEYGNLPLTELRQSVDECIKLLGRANNYKLFIIATHLFVIFIPAFYLLMLIMQKDISSSWHFYSSISALSEILFLIPQFYLYYMTHQKSSYRKVDQLKQLNQTLVDLNCEKKKLSFKKIKNGAYNLVYVLEAKNKVSCLEDEIKYSVTVERFHAVLFQILKNMPSFRVIRNSRQFIALSADMRPTLMDIERVRDELKEKIIHHHKKRAILNQLIKITGRRPTFKGFDRENGFCFIFQVDPNQSNFIETFSQCFTHCSYRGGGVIEVSFQEMLDKKNVNQFKTDFEDATRIAVEPSPDSLHLSANLTETNDDLQNVSAYDRQTKKKSWYEIPLTFINSWRKPESAHKFLILQTKDKMFDLLDPNCPIKPLEDSNDAKTERYLIYGLKRDTVEKAQLPEEFYNRIQETDPIIHGQQKNKQGIIKSKKSFTYVKHKKRKQKNSNQTFFAKHKVKLLGENGDKRVPVRFYDYADVNDKTVAVYKMDNVILTHADLKYH